MLMVAATKWGPARRLFGLLGVCKRSPKMQHCFVVAVGLVVLAVQIHRLTARVLVCARHKVLEIVLHAARWLPASGAFV